MGESGEAQQRQARTALEEGQRASSAEAFGLHILAEVDEGVLDLDVHLAPCLWKLVQRAICNGLASSHAKHSFPIISGLPQHQGPIAFQLCFEPLCPTQSSTCGSSCTLGSSASSTVSLSMEEPRLKAFNVSSPSQVVWRLKLSMPGAGRQAG